MYKCDKMTIFCLEYDKVISQWQKVTVFCMLIALVGCWRSGTTSDGSGDSRQALPIEVPNSTANNSDAVQTDTRLLGIRSTSGSLDSSNDHNAEIQLGQLYEHESRPLEFVLSNPSDSPLRIASIAISCPCATIEGPSAQVEVEAQAEYHLRLQVSAAKIPFGAFVRTVFVELQNGITQQICFRGEVLPSYDVQPSRTLDLGLLKDSGADWQQEITVKGVGVIGSALRLADQAESDLLLGQATAGGEAGSYVLRIRARNSLPYNSFFQTTLAWPVLEPAGIPPLVLTIKAVVGDDLRFEPSTFSFSDADFAAGGIARRIVTCGIIPASSPQENTGERHRASSILAGLSGLRDERFRNNVDWPALFTALIVEQPEGVTVNKIAYEHGIALQIDVRREALASSLFPQIIVRRDQHVLGRILLALQTAQAEQ